MGGLNTGPSAPVVFFKDQNTLILRHKLTCRSVTSIFSPSDNTLTLTPLGTSKAYTYKSLSEGISTAVTDPVLFPKLFDKKINRASFFPGRKVVIHFDSKLEKRYDSELSIKCIKCGKIFYETHTKSESCFIVPGCKYC
jgi:hypothetical protein